MHTLIPSCLPRGKTGSLFIDSLLQLVGTTFLFIAANLSLDLVISTIAKNQLQSMQMILFIRLIRGVVLQDAGARLINISFGGWIKEVTALTFRIIASYAGL